MGISAGIVGIPGLPPPERATVAMALKQVRRVDQRPGDSAAELPECHMTGFTG
jgi:hypothetical protein